jgi:hypothetical protein
VNFTAALAKLQREAGYDDALGIGPQQPTPISPHTLNRPVKHQPPVQTDGLDPAAESGPSPFNSGQGPYGRPVVTDPLVDQPIRPGAPVPYLPGPDLDTTTLN